MESTATVESGESKTELPRKAERANMTVGQLKKFLANYSRAKTYSRKDALGVVDKIDAGKALNESTRNDITDGKKAPTGSLPCRGFLLLCRLVQNVDENAGKGAGNHNDGKRTCKDLDLKILLFLMIHLSIPQLPDFFAS